MIGLLMNDEVYTFYFFKSEYSLSTYNSSSKIRGSFPKKNRHKRKLEEKVVALLHIFWGLIISR